MIYSYLKILTSLCCCCCCCFFFYSSFELKFAFIPSTFREQTEGENSGAEEQYQDGDGSGGGSGAAASATGGASSSHSCGRYAMRISAQARLAPLVRVAQ
jgi:hypothetical protein